MDALFDGPGVDLTSSTAFWQGDFRPVEQIPPPVRHALGYERFAQHAADDGQDPRALAGDVAQLVRYLRLRRDALTAAGDDLLDSAGIFLGNSLVARVANARWQVLRAEEPEVVQGRHLGGGPVVRRMVRAILSADDDRIREFWDLLRRWDDHDAEAEEAERRLALLPDRQVPVTRYRRPEGAGLLGALDALVAHLTTHYRATAVWTAPLPNDPATERPTVRTVRLTPASGDAAPLVVAIDTGGAIAVRAGALQEFSFWEPAVDDLEVTLLAVAAGAYREAYPIGPDELAGYRLGSIDGATESSGLARVGALDPGLHAAAATRLAALPDGWRPWELRATAE